MLIQAEDARNNLRFFLRFFNGMSDKRDKSVRDGDEAGRKRKEEGVMAG